MAAIRRIQDMGAAGFEPATSCMGSTASEPKRILSGAFRFVPPCADFRWSHWKIPERSDKGDYPYIQ